MASMGTDADWAELEGVLASIDTRHDGTITRAEWHEFVTTRILKPALPVADAAYRDALPGTQGTQEWAEGLQTLVGSIRTELHDVQRAVQSLQSQNIGLLSRETSIDRRESRLVSLETQETMVLQHDTMLATLCKKAELMAKTESERQDLEAKLLKLCNGASATGTRIGSVGADAEQLTTVAASLATLEQQVELMAKVCAAKPIPNPHLQHFSTT